MNILATSPPRLKLRFVLSILNIVVAHDHDRVIVMLIPGIATCQGWVTSRGRAAGSPLSAEPRPGSVGDHDTLKSNRHSNESPQVHVTTTGTSDDRKDRKGGGET